MAAGRPVICLDLGGPGSQVTDEVGFKIPAHSPEQCIEGIAQVMRLAGPIDPKPWLTSEMGGGPRAFSIL